MEITKFITYKFHHIAKIDDGINEFVIILGLPKHIFASIADAKRYINGQPTVYEVQTDVWCYKKYNDAAEAVTYKLLPL